MKKYNLDLTQITISITYDCTAVLDFLSHLPSIISMSNPLHLIKRELIIIIKKLGISIKLTKVRAYQDKRIDRSELTFLEKVNTICDLKAKYLI